MGIVNRQNPSNSFSLSGAKYNSYPSKSKKYKVKMLSNTKTPLYICRKCHFPLSKLDYLGQNIRNF